jgi:hypothetical protein
MKMNKAQKEQFIEGLFETLKTQTLEKVELMPEEWDAWELRQYISDKASEVVWKPYSEDRGRKRKYNNTIRTKNL